MSERVCWTLAQFSLASFISRANAVPPPLAIGKKNPFERWILQLCFNFPAVCRLCCQMVPALMDDFNFFYSRERETGRFIDFPLGFFIIITWLSQFLMSFFFYLKKKKKLKLHLMFKNMIFFCHVVFWYMITLWPFVTRDERNQWPRHSVGIVLRHPPHCRSMSTGGQSTVQLPSSLNVAAWDQCIERMVQLHVRWWHPLPRPFGLAADKNLWHPKEISLVIDPDARCFGGMTQKLCRLPN